MTSWPGGAAGTCRWVAADGWAGFAVSCVSDWMGEGRVVGEGSGIVSWDRVHFSRIGLLCCGCSGVTEEGVVLPVGSGE